MGEPTYVGMPRRAGRHPLRLTITQDIEGCYTECTVRIPRTLDVEAGRPPQHAMVGDDWVALSGYTTSDDERGYWQLEPEGLAMKFLRLAWLCAHDEITRKYPR